MNNKLLLSIVLTIIGVNSFALCSPGNSERVQKVSHPLVVSEWLYPDSIALSHLGNRLADVLLNANKVRVFKLIPKENVTSDDYEIEPHFVRESLIGQLSKDQMRILQFSLISCGANYLNDTADIRPLAAYCPIIEFEFTRKKDVAHVFVSLSDFQWGVNYDGKRQFKFNYENGIVLHRMCNYFLNKHQEAREQQKSKKEK